MSGALAIPITFYTKPGCHLCEVVEEQLEVLAERWPLSVTSVDITADLDVHRRYWDKIPVVVVGATILHAPIAAADLTNAIMRSWERKQ